MIPPIITRIAQAVRDAGGRALIVGGYVRDLLMAHPGAVRQLDGKPFVDDRSLFIPSNDIDLEVYSLDAEALRAVLSAFGSVKVVDGFGVYWLYAGGEQIEVALPRKETKIAQGYEGFAIEGDPNLDYATAFRRRDLTINAMGLDPLTGEIIDPHGGQADIKARVLRATSLETFGEDPMRVPRLAVFRARFGYDVDPATVELCRRLRDELYTITPGNLSKITRKLLSARRPGLGLRTLAEMGALSVLYPIWGNLVGIEQDARHHDEDVFEHTCLALDAGADLVRRSDLDAEHRFVVMAAIALHDVGKAVENLMHATSGAEMARSFLAQFNYGRLPGEQVTVAEHVAGLVREHMAHLNIAGDRAINRLAVRLAGADATITEWELVVAADASGRRGAVPSRPAQWIVEQATSMQSANGAPAPLVTGRLLIDRLSWKAGQHFKAALDAAFQAQLDGVFDTVEGGLEFVTSSC